jgi:ribosomal protein RSM22 (predicted rRNA methylase)
MFFAPSPVVFPPELAAALEHGLARLGKNPARRGEALRALWPKLAKGRGRAAEGERHYSFRQEEAEAYAAYYLPANCLKVPLVLEESFLLGHDPVPGEGAAWLDLGTGPGTAFWGLAWWCAQRGKSLRFTGWDQSAAFTAIARDLAAASPFPARAEFLTGDDPFALVRRLKPTHVSLVNSVAEIYADEKQRAERLAKLGRALHELERADGRPRFLLVVEPGSRESSRELAALKDSLQAAGPARALLPCLDARGCGALADPKDWCHEEVACEFPGWLNRLGAEAGLRKESLLFSYAWLRAAEDPAWRLGGCARIVSQRMERKGQVECRICTPEGKRPVRVQRSKADARSDFLFRASRGDLWRNAEIGEKGDLAGAETVPFPAGSVFRTP